jgi:hypothetical protein
MEEHVNSTSRIEEEAEKKKQKKKPEALRTLLLASRWFHFWLNLGLCNTDYLSKDYMAYFPDDRSLYIISTLSNKNK